MRVPRISVPLAPRIPFLPRHSDPDASGHRRRPGDAPGKARRLRRQRRLTQRLRQLSPFSVIRKVVFSRPIWRIGRAPVAPGVSSASADDVVLELTSGGSSSRHALLAPDRTMEVALRDDMPAPALRRRVWSLSTPAIGEQLLALGVGVSDTFLSGHLSPYASGVLHYGQATAVAAVGAAGLVSWIVLTAFFAVNVGVTALVARATGARDPKLASRAAAQGILMGGVIGLGLVALAVPMADILTVALGVDGQVAQLAAQFIRVSSLGLPAAGVASACTAAMRGAGDTRRPVLVMLLVNGVNVAASWLLLNGDTRLGIRPIGVTGSAVGSAAGWTLGAAMALFLLSRRHPLAPRLSRAALRFDRSVAARVLRIGLPSAAELVIFQMGVLTFNRQVIQLGSTEYAANITINTVESIGTLPAFGFSVAATALVGQALGANSPKLAARSAMAALWPCLAVTAALGLLALAVPQMLLGLFVADPAVLHAGALAQRLSLIILPASGATFIFNGALRGAGDTKFPVIVRAAGSWGLRVPLAALLIPVLGLPGGRIAMALDYCAQAGLAYWRFRSGKWRKSRV
ncbi:MAG TPA: MATE family efflux transporter [Ktedonobacterales bacterium]